MDTIQELFQEEKNKEQNMPRRRHYLKTDNYNRELMYRVMAEALIKN